MRRPISPPRDGVVVRVAPSQVKISEDGSVKLQCNIWIGPDAAFLMGDHYIVKEDFIKCALLSELGRLEHQTSVFGSEVNPFV